MGYSMILLVFQFVTLFSLFTLGFYVFAIDPRRRANQAFAAFNGLLAFWTVRDIIFWNFEEFAVFSDYWLITGAAASLAMMIALVIFSEDFPEPATRFRSSSLALIAPSMILLPACLGGFLWTDFDLSTEPPRLSLTVTGYVFGGYALLLFGWGVFGLVRRLQGAPDAQIRKQIATVLLGLALNAILISIPTIIFPLSGNFSWLPLSSLFAIPGVMLNAFAILNFRLFSLQSVLDEVRHFPIAHKVAITVATIAISSFVLLQLPIVWWSFKSGADWDAWVRYVTFSLIAALIPNLILVLAVLRTVSRPLKRLTVAAVETSKGHYGLQVDGRTTSDEIGILTDAFNRMSRKMSRDLATLQRMNDRLMRTEKLASIGTLSAGIAHEILNPLSAIGSIIEKIRHGQLSETDARKQLEIISQQITRVTEITREMLDFAATKTERRVSSEINEIVTDSLRLVGFDSSFKQVRVTTKLSAEPTTVDCDPDQLQQVVVNLLLNAREAITGEGEITVSTSRVDDNIVLEVSDTGCGIDPEYLSRIFDPFFTTKEQSGGTGLGLAVSYGIVKGHGGRIDAIRNHPTGTVMRIAIPLEYSNRETEAIP